ncbi:MULTISPECIES: HsdM family class I SAM-dependent methyltransferase [Methanobacterium]|uniref:site-specific DNA-methyltransferase (adenine-specific) n=1 Tax=Methanobacterium bryantii TaxID=2161 RepID=A0A2A2H6Y3_METBR|nr:MULTISPECIES: N-6 DNA methylase [Methanobacterium]OEC84936.1 restriction endonuclease [Methanobacterium sp. A39]PAV05085.1 restriction endonuclease [Methanobacterium bryantii]
MTNEKITDLFIAKLLDKSEIEYIPNDGIVKEVKNALKTASKNKLGNHGFPEFTAKSEEFILVIEDKGDLEKQAIYEDEEENILSKDLNAVKNYAENGALHYAQQIVAQTNFKKVFAFGCSGDEKHHKIRPIYVDENGYKILPEVENFENFTKENINGYYKEQVLGETPKEIQEKEDIISNAKDLHEHLRNYGALGETEKALVVSAILLALDDKDNENLLITLTGSTTKTDGEKIFDALEVHLKNAEVEPGTKTEVILNQFNIIKDRNKLNQEHRDLGKTPLKYFTEYIKENIFDAAKDHSSEDILGQFYGEFIRYSGGDGQSLGVVLTPPHITELFCDLLEIKPSDVIFDPCCGTGSFLLAGMHKMLQNAETKDDRKQIKKKQIHGIEEREDMFSIATTNMILRGDGKSNLILDDFLKTDPDDLREKRFTVGLLNPPYSQRKNKDTAHLSEIHFVDHLLDSLSENARCAVIVPQSAMIGKNIEDKQVKENILKNHTLEGVITLNTDTFYGIGVHPCIALFTAHIPHPIEKYCKFINFKDDGFTVSKHVGLIETERAKEKKKHLLDCWLHDAPAETNFMVKTQIKHDDEWLHSFYYFNDEIPTPEDFDNSMTDYLTFEFNMILQDKDHLFLEEDEND